MSQETGILTELRLQGERLGNIEKAINSIATQAVEITHLQKSVSKLWEKYDALVEDKGPIWTIRTHQGGCPREQVKGINQRLWGLYGTVFVGVLIVGARFLLGG